MNATGEIIVGKILRLIYVSRASFDFNSEVKCIEPTVADILGEARVNNREANIGGALFFAQGYFFQCIEGKERAVYSLYEKLKQDSRHNDLKISYCKHVKRRRFGKWSMKYVPVADEVLDVMKSCGYPEFSPVNFDESDINLIMDLFVRLEDNTLKDDKLRKAHRSKAAWWQRMFGLSAA